MNKKKVVFISLPMSGVNDVLVQAHLVDAKDYYLRKTGMDIHDVAFVSNITCPPPPKCPFPDLLPSAYDPLWYLGQAITKLAVVDEVIFYPGWHGARGCRIERKVCHEYDIPFMDMEE